MLCANPFVSATGLAYGCGQCMPCRYNRRRIWMHRIMLEAAQYEFNSFVTLSYSDDCLPIGGSVVPEHTQLWLKRLRRRVSPLKFRYFLVGEYGDKSERPHYHAALFGFQSCEFGQSRYSKLRSRCCSRCELVRETWGFGNVFLGTLEDDSAGYMAGYVTKKMTKGDDPRLRGRHPEFGRMSLRPGIGGDAMWDIADSLLQYELDCVVDDVPMGLRHGRKILPLGRYLRSRLRRMIGRDAKISQKAIDKMASEVLELRLAARSSKETPGIKAHILERDEGRLRSVAARAAIHKQRRSL